MSIRAVVFDIGGVLEITRNLGWDRKWEQNLGLDAGELHERLGDVWQGGSTGTITIDDVHKGIGEKLGISESRVDEFMDDLWREYLGTLNEELFEYFRNLRPRYKTAIISNSFVGAREKEEEHYHLSEVCEFIIYSHEVGMAKPHPHIFTLPVNGSACSLARSSLWTTTRKSCPPPESLAFIASNSRIMPRSLPRSKPASRKMQNK